VLSKLAVKPLTDVVFESSTKAPPAGAAADNVTVAFPFWPKVSPAGRFTLAMPGTLAEMVAVAPGQGPVTARKTDPSSVGKFATSTDPEPED